MSGSKVTLHFGITDSQDTEVFIQGYCDHNNETIKLPYTRYDVSFY